MDPHTRTTPPRSPRRAHVRRHRTHPSPPSAIEEAKPLTGGGGASGNGPIDDDDRGRRPDGDGDGARSLLIIVLGILAMGAGVMSARLLTKSSHRRI